MVGLEKREKRIGRLYSLKDKLFIYITPKNSPVSNTNPKEVFTIKSLPLSQRVLVTHRIEFSQKSVEKSESARPQVLQVILSAFWRIVDKKGTAVPWLILIWRLYHSSALKSSPWYVG